MVIKSKKRSGFTVIELLVVIAVLGLLASMVFVHLRQAKASARDAERKGEIDSIRKALAFYYTEHNEYPEYEGWISLEEEDNLIAQALSEWLPEMPEDPLWEKTKDNGEPFSYQYSTGDTGGYGYRIHVEMEGEAYSSHEVASVGGGGIVYGGEWTCGDTITFTYRGGSVTYGTVLNNGECWMDRNLGASQQATASDDYFAYGDLFQWGRLDDGHQTIVWTSSSGSDGAEQSRETPTNSSIDVPGHDDFILEPDEPYDWRDPQNNALWQGVSGTNNPCPSGWRIPTETELDTERLSWGSNNSAGAYASTLKFVVAGYRNRNAGAFYYVGSRGYYWSSTVSGTDARRLTFHGSDVSMRNSGRAGGLSVRCLKD